MGAVNAKSKFTFYNDIKLHNCIEIRGKKKERIHYNQYLSGLTKSVCKTKTDENHRG